LLGATIGFIIIFTFVISLINPGTGNDSSSDVELPTLTPFGTPAPTLTPTRVIVPTPEENPQLAGELPYVHSSGAFQTFRPSGGDWAISDNPFEEGERLNVVFQSGARLVVIHNFVQPGVEFESPDTLSQNYLTPEYYATEWSRYNSWAETGRQINGDTVIVDFDLLSEGNPYLGRDIARLEGDRLYVTRLVVPSNNRPLLDLLQQLVTPVFVSYPDLQNLPRTWTAYADQQQGFVFKHAPGWTVAAGGYGRPVTFRAPTGQPEATVRAWAVADQPVATEEDARAWLAETEPTATVTEVQPVEHQHGTGYALAYQYEDRDGDPHSGLLVLLNNEANVLLVANLHYDTPDLNLLSVEDLEATVSEARQMLVEGFVALPPDAYRLEMVAEATEQATETATEQATEAS
jgi:hypothetical protein